MSWITRAKDEIESERENPWSKCEVCGDDTPMFEDRFCSVFCEKASNDAEDE